MLAYAYAKALALSALAVFAPIKPLLWATLFLVCFDTVTGVFAARKKGEAVSSAKLRRCVSKALVYSAALLCGHVAGLYLLASDIPVKLIAGALGTVELLSVLENLNRITGGSVFKGVLSKLGSPNEPPKE